MLGRCSGLGRQPAGDPGQPYPPNTYGAPPFGPGSSGGYGAPEPSTQSPQQRGSDEWDTYRDFRS